MRPGSRLSARLVEAINMTLGTLTDGRGIASDAGNSELTQSMSLPMNLWRPVGSSNDCNCTSSSLTAICRSPPAYGVVIVVAGNAYDDGRVVVPEQPATWVDGCAVMATPERASPNASNSSMKPIAPPSLRAALRNAPK